MAINFDHQRDRISSSSGSISFPLTGALTVPVGTTAQRPTSVTGQIRFNSQTQVFEGYNGAGWSSLGGVRDVDGNTYIQAETSPGTDNNQLDFYTDGTQRMQIGATGDALFGDGLNKLTIAFTTGNLVTAGSITADSGSITNDLTVGGNVQVNGNLTVDGIATLKAGADNNIDIGDTDDTTDTVTFNARINSNLIPDIDATYDLGSTTENWSTAFVQTLDSSTESITIDTTGSLVLPVGTVAQRPGTPTQGMIRYNSDDTTFEGYDGTAWGSLGGVKDVDQDTYIEAETAPGDDNDQLKFYVGGTESFRIDTDGDIQFGDGLNKLTVDWATGNTSIAGSVTADSGTITNNLDVGGDVTVTGNLTVEGNTTTVDTTTLNISDPLIKLGDGNIAQSIDQGIVFTRGDGVNEDVNNVSFLFDESEDEFALVSTPTEDGTTSSDVVIADYSPLHIGALTADDGASVGTNLSVGNDLTVTRNATITNDLTVQGNADITGNLTLGGNITIGDADTDAITVGGEFDSNLIPDADVTYDLGSQTKNWRNLFVDNIDSNNDLTIQTNQTTRLTITGSGQLTSGTGYSPVGAQDLATKDYVDNQSQGTAGAPTDGSWTDGAYLGFTNSDKVVDILDELNESLENVRRGTFVRSVTFTASPTSGGEGTTITLNLNVTGNANLYDIIWGDGTSTNATTDSTPSHTYTSNANSPYTVTVRAYNNGAISGTAGSEASHTETDYIIIYTADPSVAFRLYRAASGGSALTGNDLYVIEGDDLYMENITTNTSMATVTYTMDWGDGSVNDSIASDSAAGGVSGTRLQHTWATGTNTATGRDTLTLTLASHTTANPAVIPSNGTELLKVYDPSIGSPAGLSTKTISYSGSSTGTSPLLANGATDNSGGVTSYTAGDSVLRTIATSGNIESTEISTYAFDASGGILTAHVNGSTDGSVTFDNTDNAGTYTSLVVTDEEDYNLLNNNGAPTSFAQSIYHPGLYTGFKAKVSQSAASVATGIHTYQLRHSATGNTNTIEFVKDDVTQTPTLTTGTVAQNTAGTFRYISGIPYYNGGSPDLTLSGLTIDDFIGQTYRNTTQVVEVSGGTNYEGTSQSAIATQYYTYADIEGVLPLLTGGNPNANTGNGTPYALGALDVNITTSPVRTVESLQVRAYNVNGTGQFVNQTEKVQVHTANQSGISEIAIDVSTSLGSGFVDDGVRIFDFSGATTNNPSITGATNYYTNNPYTEAADPGVQGTKEATIRLGVLKHDVTNYSTGFLPVGPNRSGDSGTQYFTFAFRRQVVANFNINITSTTGVAGVWIAAPGTTIDNTSSINGWLDCSTQYAGAGVPGANTGNGGNGSDGCASTGADRIQSSVALSGSYTMTLGTENLTNATGNVALVRIALASGQSITSLSIT